MKQMKNSEDVSPVKIKPMQELLVRALVSEDQIALEYCKQWLKNVDLENIDGGSYSLMPMLYRKLVSLESSDIKSDIMDRLETMIHDLEYLPEYCIRFKTSQCTINYRLCSDNIVDVPVGFFSVFVNFKSQYVEIRQQDPKMLVDGEHDHPHVLGGSPCWGSYDNMLYPALKSCHIPAVVSIILLIIITMFKRSSTVKPFFKNFNILSVGNSAPSFIIKFGIGLL